MSRAHGGRQPKKRGGDTRGKSNGLGSRTRKRPDIQGRLKNPNPEVPELSIPIPYDERTIRERLSPERLARYEKATKNSSLTKALELYVWNAQMSAALFEQIHYVEIVMRNALHAQLAASHAGSGLEREWYERTDWFGPPGDDGPERRHLDAAVKRVRDRYGTESRGRIVSELPFGFWRILLGRRHHQTLWEPALRHAFPNMEPRSLERRTEVFNAVDGINDLRNRIAHHEPIFDRDHLEDQRVILELLSWLCGDSRDWADANSRVYWMSRVQT